MDILDFGGSFDSSLPPIQAHHAYAARGPSIHEGLDAVRCGHLSGYFVGSRNVALQHHGGSCHSLACRSHLDCNVAAGTGILRDHCFLAGESSLSLKHVGFLLLSVSHPAMLSIHDDSWLQVAAHLNGFRREAGQFSFALYREWFCLVASPYYGEGTGIRRRFSLPTFPT